MSIFTLCKKPLSVEGGDELGHYDSHADAVHAAYDHHGVPLDAWRNGRYTGTWETNPTDSENGHVIVRDR